MASGDTLVVFTPLHGEPSPTYFPTFDVRNGHPVLDFADNPADDQWIRFTSVLPRHYSGSGITVRIHFAMSSATSGNTVWIAAFERMDAGGINIDSDDFAFSKSVTVAVPSSSGQIGIAELTFADGSEIDNLQAGEGFRLQVCREGNNVNDDAVGDAELLLVELKET